MKKTTKKEHIIKAPRPIYNENVHPYILQSLATQGVRLTDIAKRLGIAIQTLYNWFEKYPEFRMAYDLGIQSDNELVEASYYRLCLPHFLTETETHYDKNGEVIKTVVRRKEVDPNANAAYRFLACKKRKEWLLTKGEIESLEPVVIQTKCEDEEL